LLRISIASASVLPVRPRAERQRDELAALVLDLEAALLERLQREGVRVAVEHEAPGGEARRRRADALLREAGEQVVAAALQDVRAHGERRALVERPRELARLLVAELGAQPRRDPARQRRLDREAGVGVGDRRDARRGALEPGERARLDAEPPRGGLGVEAAVRAEPRGVAGGVIERGARQPERPLEAALPADEAVGRLGGRAPLVRVEPALAAQHALERAVGEPALVVHEAVDLEHDRVDEVLAQRALPLHRLASTSAACPSTFTFGNTRSTLPSGPITTVVRSVPITFLPYMFFSFQTP
jgi:hypothetical protein